MFRIIDPQVRCKVMMVADDKRKAWSLVGRSSQLEEGTLEPILRPILGDRLEFVAS
jgi:hypothetical protein